MWSVMGHTQNKRHAEMAIWERTQEEFASKDVI